MISMRVFSLIQLVIPTHIAEPGFITTATTTTTQSPARSSRTSCQHLDRSPDSRYAAPAGLVK